MTPKGILLGRRQGQSAPVKAVDTRHATTDMRHVRYGFRRMAVKANGVPRRFLKADEKKPVKTDRIILVRGPEREVRCIQSIFKMFLWRRMNCQAIADQLNREGIKYRENVKWYSDAVLSLLQNPKCAGYYPEKGISAQSKSAARRRWEKAFAPMVAKEDFERVQKLLRAESRGRRAHLSDEELISELKRSAKTSVEAVAKLKLQKSSTYIRRFGTVRRAYELAGLRYDPQVFVWMERREGFKQLYHQVLNQLLDSFPRELKVFRMLGGNRQFALLLDGKHTLVVQLCRFYQGSEGTVSWELRPITKSDRNSLTLICTLERGDSEVRGFYLCPTQAVGSEVRRFREDDPLLARAMKVEKISALCMTARKLISATGITISRDLPTQRQIGLANDMLGRS